MADAKPPRLGIRLAAEFVVIVLGVLVALAVDGMVQQRADRREELQVLELLQTDLAASLEELRLENEFDSVRIEFLTRFLSFPIDGSRPYPVDSLVNLAFAVHYTASYEPVMRGHELLVATGGFDLLENPEITRGLADLTRATAAYVNYRAQATDQWNLTYSPIYYRWIGAETGSLIGDEDPPGPLPPPDVLAALRDREFRGAIARRRAFLYFNRRYGEGLAAVMENLITLVDQELASRT